MTRPAAALLAVLLFGGCAHVTSWGKCVASRTEWESVVTEVAEDLAVTNYPQLLADLGARVGKPAVECAVQEFLNRARARQRQDGTLSARDSVRAQRAEAWLKSR